VDDFSVAQIGPYPPPYGGVSVHIQRLHRRLANLGVVSRVYCQRSSAAGLRGEGVVPVHLRFSWYGWVLEHAWRCRATIVHFHDGWHWAPAAVAMLLRGRTVVMTLHNQRAAGEMWQRTSWPGRWVSRRLLRHRRVWWVAVSQEVKRQLVDKGIPAERITVAPAYIPPGRGATASTLPEYVRDFLGAHAPVLSSYGWKLIVDAQGVDLYGFDQCIEAIRALRAEFPTIGLAISLPQIADAGYFRDLRARVAAARLEEHVLFITEPLDDVHRLWQASDVHVRATNTDGDAVAVREALELRVPVVASDASTRPPGTVLFKTRDLESLVGAVREVLTHHADHVQALQSVTIEDNFPPLLELYRAIA
jgi:glycosyltransferase involved in cell wall biosynthesis